MFPGFHGNPGVVSVLEDMIRRRRIPQTILLDGPTGIGKATLARRFAAALVGDAARIEKDDLSTPGNVALIAEREKLPSDKRADDPLLFSSHPDFVTFPPDGPLRQISIQQMRLLKDRAQFKPLHGDWRVFLIDGIDRANEQAANSLLKTLEEPPPHLIVIMTALNPYDLLPTIRSRSVPFHLGPLSPAEMRDFAQSRRLPQPDRRIALAQGSPGHAMAVDLEAYDKRRAAMLTLLAVAANQTPFAEWMKHSEAIGARRTEKLDFYIEVLYILLEDILLIQHGAPPARNPDAARELQAIAQRVSFEWVRSAVQRLDDLVEFARRNIQKTIALDALALSLRPAA